MDNPVNPAPVTLTIPGLCRWLPVSPSPLAMEVTELDGVPVVPVALGLRLTTGQPVVLTASSLDYLDALEYHVQVARARLAMWTQDHGLHPLEDVA